jgi:creatinine amidohydrolase
MLLAIAPQRVALRDAVAGDTRPLAEIWPLLRAGGVRAVSDSGILGDPAGAHAAEGVALLDKLAGELIDAVDGWVPR